MIGKLHKAESVLFRCTKIRKSKLAELGCDRGRVRLKCPVHGALRLLSLCSMAKHYIITARLRFTNFLTKLQKQSQFVQVASH